MQLIIFDGRMGSGKTLGMSLLSYYFQSRSQCTLFSNYGLRDSLPFTSFDDFFKVVVQPSSLICLDEAHVDLDSRNFNTNAVKYFTHLVFYLRKMRSTILMTSPLFENIETRVRGVTNLYCHMEKNTSPYYYYRFYDIETLTLKKSLRIKKSVANHLASEIFNTYEMVEPIQYPDSKKDFEDFLARLKQAHRDFLTGHRRAS